MPLALQERGQENSPSVLFSILPCLGKFFKLPLTQKQELDMELLDHAIYFPDKADLFSVFPSASSVLWISLCFCCLGFFFQSGVNQVLYLSIKKRNFTLLWHSCLSCCRKYCIIGLSKFQCIVLPNGSLLGSNYLIYIRWVLSICMVLITVLSSTKVTAFFSLSVCTVSCRDLWLSAAFLILKLMCGDVFS